MVLYNVNMIIIITGLMPPIIWGVSLKREMNPVLCTWFKIVIIA
uniref:Uncharacterized protein n=1 Tax=Rhizophora mucronata TaxID=61149 RepID=A0A2P2PQA2_RHIMU